jgi:hypothetical protein
MKYGTWMLAALVAAGLAGCAGDADPNTPAGQKQIAAEASKQAAIDAKEGRSCEAAQAEENDATYADECTAQKNREAATNETGKEDEAIREAERLKAEGKAP